MSDQKEILELEQLLEEIDFLRSSIKALLESSDDEQLRGKLQDYLSAVNRIPRILMLLNDYRRHVARLAELSKQVITDLKRVRGGFEDAVSSEELRIADSCSSVNDSLLTVISAFESLLSFVRSTSDQVMSALSFSAESFNAQFNDLIPSLRLDWMSSLVDQQYSLISHLSSDVKSLFELSDHVKELSDEN